MAKKGKKIGKPHYELKHRESFIPFLKTSEQKPTITVAGFKVKNINQLWRWDTLEDINHNYFI